MGIEPSFYVQDKEKPNLFAFNPCGHVATEKTVKYDNLKSIESFSFL